MDDIRSQIFNTLNQKDTDELVAIWKSNNRSEWSNVSFEVLREILQNRLGELPPQDPDSFPVILENGDPKQRIEAATALAKLGNDKGLDYLIGALKNPDKEVSMSAEKNLSELNIPRGVLALHSHLLETNRTIYREKKGTSGDEKRSYAAGYIVYIALNILALIFIYILPLPVELSCALQLATGYFVFKYVVNEFFVRA